MDTKALRQKILDLAIRGKLVPQDPNDEPASVLLERIREQKKQMVKDGKLKPKDIKKDTVIFKGDDNLHYEKFPDGSVKCIEDEIPFNLPEGWAWCRLNSIATFELGKTLDTAKNTGTYKPYLRSVNVRWNSIDLNDINCMKFEPDELTRYSIKKGDLLICEGGDVGRSCVWEKDEEMYYQNALHRVRFYMNINPYFYMYIMMYYANSGKLQEICKGVTIKHLTRTTLLTLLFPLPPQNESLNIINKISKFDSLLRKLEENKNNISYLISCTKSKILDLAIRGKLVPQNSNDEPASMLLERIRAEKEELIKQGKIKRNKKESVIFKGDDNSYYEKVDNEVRCIDTEIPYDLPDGWIWCRLGNIGEWQTGATPSRKKTEYYNGTMPWIKTGDLNNGYIKVVPESITELAITNTSVKIIPENTVIIAMYGATIGKVGITTSTATTNQACCACCNPKMVREKYLFYFLMSYKNAFVSIAEGGAQPNISKEKITATLIPFPSIAEQIRIYTAIDNAFSVLDYIEKLLN